MADANWGEAGKGAAGGALTGAAIGSVVPGIGTGVGAIGGAVIGGLGGLFSGDGPSYTADRNNFTLPGWQDRGGRLLSGASNAAGRRADYSANTTINPFQRASAGQIGESDYRRGQNELGNYLLNTAQGRGPSLAMEQAKQQGARNIAAARSMAAGARGPGAALASLQARDQMGNINQQTAAQAVQGALAERMAAAGQAGNVFNTGRAQDLQRMTDQQQLNYGASAFNAGQQNQRTLHQADLNQNNNQFNVGSTYQNRQINDAAQLEFLRQEMQNAQLQQYGMMGYEGALAGKYSVDASQPTFGDQMMAGGSAVGAAWLGRKG